MLEKDFLKYCEEALNKLFQNIEENDKNSKLDIEFKELYDKDNKSHQSGFKYFKTLNKKFQYTKAK